jgi:hypothetical protein
MGCIPLILNWAEPTRSTRRSTSSGALTRLLTDTGRCCRAMMKHRQRFNASSAGVLILMLLRQPGKIYSFQPKAPKPPSRRSITACVLITSGSTPEHI